MAYLLQSESSEKGLLRDVASRLKQEVDFPGSFPPGTPTHTPH